MESLELVLQVTCRCGNGNIILDSTYFDSSIMTCTVCDIKERINCYYVDELLDMHEYNSTITEEVKILNNNGKWIKNHQYQFIEKSPLDEMLIDYTSICEVNCQDKITYYRKNLDFIRVEYWPVHNRYQAYKFIADESKIINLLNYFK